jgi:hypothetical protein
MNQELSVISVNLLLLLQICLGFFWGFAWAGYLQFTRHGQFLVLKRTWITVVIGIGVDLAIAYGSEYWTVVLVIAVSSVGIIVRSLWNEQVADEAPNINSHKLKYALEDSLTVCSEMITGLTTILANGDLTKLSFELARAHYLHEILLAARRGETIKKVKRFNT